MTIENLKNKIGMQIGFLLYSDKPVKEVIQHIADIAEIYANEKDDAPCTPSSK